MRYAHGGDIYEYRIQFDGRDPLDFSANINPRGIPDPVKAAMHRAVDACMQYPDAQCRALKQALGQHWHLSPECFFCGNGAAEVFYRLVYCLKPRTALLTAPTFGEYEQALATQGCAVRFHTLFAQDGFHLTEQFLFALTPEVDLVILCNPNNPTGCTVSPVLMQQILERCRKNHIWLVIDECFQDFLIHPSSMCSALVHSDRLVIVRAFTKMYAVPGVRLGWCMAHNPALIEALHTVGQPWNVSVIAQACGLAALSCEGWEKETALYIQKQRIWLEAELAACGMRVFPAEANYILFESERLDLKERLMERGILIRSCENYRGLGKGYFRIAVREEQENQTLMQNIQEVLTDGKINHGAGHCI